MSIPSTLRKLKNYRIVFCLTLAVISVVGLNYYMIYHVPALAEGYSDRGQELPLFSEWVVHLVIFLKDFGLLAIAVMAPASLAIIPRIRNLDPRVFYPSVLVIYCIPFLAIAVPAFIGVQGPAIKQIEVPTAEELAAVPLVSAPQPEKRFDVEYIETKVIDILDEVARDNGLSLIYDVSPPIQSTTFKLSNVTWRQVFEIALKPVGYTFLEDWDRVHIVSPETLRNEGFTTFAVKVNGDPDAIRATLSLLIDTGAGGSVYVDHIRNALVITERPSRRNDILFIINREDEKSPTNQHR